jgi:hypothetical protein
MILAGPFNPSVDRVSKALRGNDSTVNAVRGSQVFFCV